MSTTVDVAAESLSFTGGGGEHDHAVVSLLEESQHKLAAITAIEAAGLTFLTLYLLRRFASPAVPWWVLLFVLSGWLLGFSGALLLPLDLAFTKSNDLFSSHTLVQYWEGMFWTSTVLANAVFPLLKGVVSSGAFSCGRKLRDSLRKSLIFYVVVVCIGAAALVWVWLSGQTMAAFLGFIMALSNIYGLLLIIVLMSYGFVDVPRYLWRLGDYQRRLRWLQSQAVSVESAAYEADVALKNVCNQVAEVVAKMRGHQGAKTSLSPSLADAATQLEVCAGQHVPSIDLRSSEVERGSFEVDGRAEKNIRRDLEALHAHLLSAQMRCHQAHARWDDLVVRAVALSDLAARRNGYNEGSPKPRQSLRDKLSALWGTYLAPWFYKLVALFAALLSAVLVWSELTIAIPVSLSPLGFFITALEERGDAALLQVASLVPLLYMTFATHRSLMQLKLPFVDSQHMYDGRQTGSYALLFNATYVCTLQFTLGFNYLTLLQLGEWSSSEFAVPDCAFTNVTGSMDVLPVLGSSFFVFFPVVMALMVVVFAFRIHARLLRLCGASVDESSDGSGNDNEESGTLAEGIALIQERKRSLESQAVA